MLRTVVKALDVCMDEDLIVTGMCGKPNYFICGIYWSSYLLFIVPQECMEYKGN
jgi:hypothetical protein